MKIRLNEDEEARLPDLIEGEMVPVDSLDITAHQTEPKPRYTEASLVKALEELGIGRPSTYASIIATLQKREYVVMDKKRFVPTEIGAIVSLFLTNHLTKYVDLQFTANLEDTLDNIAIGKSSKLPTLHQFWNELYTLVTEKQNISKMELTSENWMRTVLSVASRLFLALVNMDVLLAVQAILSVIICAKSIKMGIVKLLRLLRKSRGEFVLKMEVNC